MTVKAICFIVRHARIFYGIKILPHAGGDGVGGIIFAGSGTKDVMLKSVVENHRRLWLVVTKERAARVIWKL